jgi:ubiquinol-cytochrome c reductase cytochrome b/c1 subunit
VRETTMTLKTRLAGLALAVACVAVPVVAGAADDETPARQTWSFSGPFGTFDREQIQRGLKVYREVCSACHGLSYIAFRNLADPGGPGYSLAQAAAIAAEYQIEDGPNDQGEMFQRPGRLADYFPTPWKNEQEARARFNGAVPPDLSMVAKARTYERGFPWFLFDIFTQYQEQGPDYIVAVMEGYADAPKGFTLPPGTQYNKAFPAHAIAMPPPLTDGRVEYTDGTPDKIDNYAHDVAAFLVWASDPHMEQRKRIGLQAMIFLLVLAGLLYFTKKKVWHEIEVPREVAHGQDPSKTTI